MPVPCVVLLPLPSNALLISLASMLQLNGTFLEHSYSPLALPLDIVL